MISLPLVAYQTFHCRNGDAGDAGEKRCTESMTMTNRTRPPCPECKNLMIPYVYGMTSGPPSEDGGPDDFYVMGFLPSEPGERVPEWGCRICQIKERDELDRESGREFGPNWMHDLMDEDEE